MKLEASNKQIWSLAYPVIVGAIAEHVIGLTDSAFLGEIGDGETSLGASVIATVWYFVFVTFGMGLSSGAQVIVARRMGEENPKGVGETMKHAFLLAGILSVVVFAALFLLSEPLLSMMVESKAVLSEALTYLRWRIFDIPFMIFFLLIRGFFNGIGENKIIMFAVGVMALTNATLNYVLVFGKFGAPALGIAGSGLASGLAQIVCLLICLGYFFHQKYPEKYEMGRFGGFKRSLLRSMVELSAPTTFQFMISVSSFFFMILLIEKMGPHALGVTGLVKNLYIFIMIPTWGFSTATGVISANLMGQKTPNRIPLALIKTIRFNLLFSLGYLIVLFIFAHPILGEFTKSAQLAIDSVTPLRIALVALAIYIVAGNLLSAVIAVGATKIAFFVELAAITLYLGYIYAVVFIYSGNLPTVWGAEIVYMIVIAAAAYGYLRFGAWRKIVI